MQYILHPVLLSVFVSVISAQLLKTIFDTIRTHHFNWRSLFRGAGMPSSHTATVTSLAIGVYLYEGFTTQFIIAFVFAALVIRDVIGDKVFATHQENIINRFIEEIRHHQKVTWNHLIGHSLVEVSAGFVLATILTFCVFYFAGVL